MPNTAVQVLSVDLHRPEPELGEPNRCNARVRLVLPKYKLVASCEGEADGPVHDMLIAHGMRHGHAGLLGLLGWNDREYDRDLAYIERTDSGFDLWVRDGEELAEGEVELYEDRGGGLSVSGHPYNPLGTPLAGWCSDALVEAIRRAYGDGSDAERWERWILDGIQSAVDKVARGLAPLGCIEPVSTRGKLVQPADDEIATLTLVIRYFKPNAGQLTSCVSVEASETSIALDGHDANSIRVWSSTAGLTGDEPVGAELHRCIMDAAELMLAPWCDAAEQLRVAYAQARRDRGE